VRRGQINFPERAKTQFSDQNIQLVPTFFACFSNMAAVAAFVAYLLHIRLRYY
jgi:hypothetical protein